MSLGSKAFSLLISNGLHALSHVVILVICSRLLIPFQYGSYRQFFTVYEIAVPLLGLGLSQAIFYFFARSSSRIVVVILAIKILFFVSLLFAVVIYIFGDVLSGKVFHSEILGACLPFVVPFTFFSLVLPVIAAVFVDAGRAKTLALFNSMYVVVLAASVSLAAYWYRDVIVVVAVRVVIVCSFVCFLFFFLKRNSFLVSPRDSSQENPVQFSILDVLKYSVPLGVASAAGMLSQQIDKIIVSSFSTPEIFAVYVNGAMEIPLISILTGALATASISDLSRKVKDGLIDEALGIFKSVASLSSVVLIPALVYFFFCAEVFMVFLFGEKYIESALPFRIYLLLIPARLVFFGPVLIAFGKTKLVLVRSIVELLLTAVIGTLLTYFFGYSGVAAAIVIVTYAWSVAFNLSQLRSCFNVSLRELLPYRSVAKKFLLSLMAAPLLFLPGSLGIKNAMGILTFSFLLYFSAILILFFIANDPDFKRLLSFIKKEPS